MSGPSNPNVAVYSSPAKYEDGSPIPANKIAKFEYGYAQVAQATKVPRAYTVLVSDTDFSADANGKQFGPIPPTLPFGQWYGATRTYTTDGAVSDWGNEVAFTVDAKKPAPIVDFSVA